MRFNPITHDPTEVDAQFPADMVHLDIESGGIKLLNVFYTTQGAEPHPTVLLLHGIPGMERNLDLAHTFRRAGWHVLVIHYRGNWGSGGTYTFNNTWEDSLRAIEVLRDPQIVEKYRIDPNQIIAIGHSLGGWLALMLAAQGILDAAVSIAGVNMGMWGELLRDEPESRPPALEFFDSVQAPLSGSSGQALVDEMIVNPEAWNLMRKIDEFAGKKLLLIAGERDMDVHMMLHHSPLVATLQQVGSAQVTEEILDAEHTFSDKRIVLAQIIVEWLAQ